MKTSRRLIPLLIILALLCLIGLQLRWLVFVHKYKTQELCDRTREAVLETTKRIQKEEDAHFLINKMDSVLLRDSLADNDGVGIEGEEEVRVIVSNIKKDLSLQQLSGDSSVKKKIKIIRDTPSYTTLVELRRGKEKKVTVRSKSVNTSSVKERAKELESLFWEMAVSSTGTIKDIHARIDSQEVQNILSTELQKQGIDLVPEIGIFYSARNNGVADKDNHMVFSTPGFAKSLPALVALPLFPDDLFGEEVFIKVGYGPSKNSFVIKQMGGLLALSFSITILIGFVMITIFRRLLSQEKLHRLKNDFVNNMTHELKTPIATTRLALEALSNPQIKNSEVRFSDYIRILKEENLKLNAHVERVLQMSLLEKGELQLNKKPVDLVLLIKDCINTYALQIAEHKAQVIFPEPPAPIMMFGDEEHLQSVFNNLLDNALKYSSAPCQIEIGILQDAERTQIVFKDNGIGIDKEHRERIFEKFYRAQGGNLHDVKGFGLGLSYVRSIVEAHGGNIEVVSDRESGSEFTLRFIAA